MLTFSLEKSLSDKRLNRLPSLDSLWLHVRANGHWTRRVYDLFRMKLKQEHGGLFNDFNDLRLRSSMRSRMSKSYIDELRGIHQDLNNNDDLHQYQSNRSSDCSTIAIHPRQTKSISITVPSIQHRALCSSCQSTISLQDIQLTHREKSILINPNDLEDLTVEEIEKYAYEKDPIKPKTILKSTIKSNDRLTVPNIGDYCIRISDGSLSNEQHPIELNETRLSDALGYLRMYKNHNRIHFNSLQFNDREDLQVNQRIVKKRKDRCFFI